MSATEPHWWYVDLGSGNGLVQSGKKPQHDDVIKWKHFPRNWPFVREIHRSPVNFPHKGQWRGALMFTLICVRMNGWVNNREAGDLRRYRVHYDVIVMAWAKADLALCHHTVLLCHSALSHRILDSNFNVNFPKHLLNVDEIVFFFCGT